MLHIRTVHSDQSYERLRIQIIHAPYGFKYFAREINRGRELFLNFSRGCANNLKFGGARNYSRACNIRVIRVGENGNASFGTSASTSAQNLIQRSLIINLLAF